MATVIKTTFKLRRGLLSEWNSKNPVLASGEPGFALDANILKIGDGISSWNDLPSVGGSEVLNDYYTKEEIQQLLEEQKVISQRYEITFVPEGTLVDYREDEIRVMCPFDTQWKKQVVGPTGNANLYYMAFRAYAPEGAVGFKEGDQGVVKDEYFDFSGDFAGTDKYGRNYSICWLALASYDATTDTWTYFGKNSTTSRYIGWTYVVEWYGADGKVIAGDSIKINLSNEECHYEVKPYYMGAINVNTLVQDKNDVLVLYGGSASENL